MKEIVFSHIHDDYLRYTMLYWLHSKDEVPDKLEQYLTQVGNTFVKNA